MSYHDNNKGFKFTEDDPEWSNNIKSYEHDKKNLPWKVNPMPRYIHHKEMLERDLNFNPILQKYNDKNYDSEISKNEDRTLKRSLSQYYDNALRYEQTFDIINLQDRLKGFESHPDYPQYKEKEYHQSKYCPSANRGYNILSNKSLAVHNNIPYENRPSDDSQIFNLPKPQQIKAVNYKDYNIVNNCYKENDEIKSKLDKEISYLAAAKRIYSRKDYDIIKNKYYNPDMQKDIEEKERKKNDINRNVIPYKGQLYNPINMSVYDKDNLALKDSKQYNRINRYRLRPSLDDYYRRKDYEREIRSEKRLLNKLDYKRFQLSDKRGYDLLNMKDIYNKYKDNFYQYKNQNNDWERIQNGGSDNKTISISNIYKDPYDKADLDDNLYRFKQNRKKELNRLKPIENEEIFKANSIRRKVVSSSVDNVVHNKTQEIINKISMNKEDWFKKNKSIDMQAKV